MRNINLVKVNLSSFNKTVLSVYLVTDPESSSNWLTNKVKLMTNRVNVQLHCALKKLNT